jgi:hypothetical protein
VSANVQFTGDNIPGTPFERILYDLLRFHPAFHHYAKVNGLRGVLEKARLISQKKFRAGF